MVKIKFQVFLQSTTHPLKIDVGLHFGGFGPDCIFIGRAIDAALVSFDIALVSLGFALVGFDSKTPKFLTSILVYGLSSVK